MKYCFDLDGTLCSAVINSQYELAMPFVNAINAVNVLYDDGHEILIFTGRGSTSGKDWTAETERQLSRWGVKYHRLIMNQKPAYDIFVDDKAINAVEWRRSLYSQRGILAGAFDVIHPGYCRMFEYAKTRCDHLTVAIHEDPSIENGKLKPVFSLEDRIEVLRSIRWIDDIVVYKKEQNLVELLASGSYNIRFLGDDYKTKEYTGMGLAIKIDFVPRNHNYSATAYKKAIANAYPK